MVLGTSAEVFAPVLNWEVHNLSCLAQAENSIELNHFPRSSFSGLHWCNETRRAGHGMIITAY